MRAGARCQKVRYVTSFFLVKPVDMTQAGGFMWHEVPNRAGGERPLA